MSVQISQATIAAYAFVAIFGLIILRRAYLVTHGTRATVGRLLVLPVFYILIFAGLMVAVLYGAVGSSVADQVYAAFGVDIALLLAGSFVAYGYAQRRVHLYRDPGATDWNYRLNSLLPVIYVVLFFARTGLETAFLGISPFDVPSAAQLASTSLWTLYVLFAVDAMWGLSTGFLVGRNAAVYNSWQRKLAEATGASPPDAVLP
ncbi:MAG TPA: hypothetical protein VMF04_03930 [Thermoplasmata archaeon]|nr:hypothetical protein [Thermoplasmata archaeon]